MTERQEHPREHYKDALLELALGEHCGTIEAPDLSERILKQARVVNKKPSPCPLPERERDSDRNAHRPNAVRRMLGSKNTGISLAAASVLIGVALMIFGPITEMPGTNDKLRLAVSPDARYAARGNQVELFQGWLLLDSTTPTLRTDAGHVESVHGRVLVKAGGPPGAADITSSPWLNKTLTVEEQNMLSDTKRWITTGGVAMLALAGSFVLNGVTYSTVEAAPQKDDSIVAPEKPQVEPVRILQKWVGKYPYSAYDKDGTTYIPPPPLVQAIVDQDAWLQLWLDVLDEDESATSELKAPAVDFSKNVVVAVCRSFAEGQGEVGVKDAFRNGNSRVLRCEITGFDPKQTMNADSCLFYGFFLLPRADISEAGEIIVEFENSDLANYEFPRPLLPVTCESIDSGAFQGLMWMRSWSEVGRVSIVQAGKSLEDAAAKNTQSAGTKIEYLHGMILESEEAAKNFTERAVYRYGTDPTETRRHVLEEVTKKFDDQWGAVLKKCKNTPPGGSVDFSKFDAVIAVGEKANLTDNGFVLSSTLENDKVIQLRIDIGTRFVCRTVLHPMPGGPATTLEVDADETTQYGRPFAIFLVPRSEKRAVHVYYNAVECAGGEATDGTFFAYAPCWHNVGKFEAPMK